MKPSTRARISISVLPRVSPIASMYTGTSRWSTGATLTSGGGGAAAAGCSFEQPATERRNVRDEPGETNLCIGGLFFEACPLAGSARFGALRGVNIVLRTAGTWRLAAGNEHPRGVHGRASAGVGRKESGQRSNLRESWRRSAYPFASSNVWREPCSHSIPAQARSQNCQMKLTQPYVRSSVVVAGGAPAGMSASPQL